MTDPVKCPERSKLEQSEVWEAIYDSFTKRVAVLHRQLRDAQGIRGAAFDHALELRAAHYAAQPPEPSGEETVD